MNVFREYLILVPTVAFFVSVLSKGIYLASIRKLTLAGALGTGGMPSVHSALVTSITTAVGIKYGPFSDLFTVSVVFAAIIIYDALNVRFEAGLHAKAINRMADTEFNESIGHLPREAFVGSCMGISTAFALLAF